MIACAKIGKRVMWGKDKKKAKKKEKVIESKQCRHEMLKNAFKNKFFW